MMLKVGLTGNIGSGKTVVSLIFGSLGTPVFHADLEGRKLLEIDEIIDQIRDSFGKGVISVSGDVLRHKLAEIVFNDQEELDRLNRIIHPAVYRSYDEWCEKYQEEPYTIYEAAILIETGHYKELDKTICVTAPQEIRIRRVMERDKISREQVAQRMANQWDEEKKIALADFIIKNDGSESLIEQVMKIHRILVQR